MTRYEFCQIFSKAWYKAMTGSNIVSSFKTTGIYPFNRHAFDDLVVEEHNEPLVEKKSLYVPLLHSI